MACQLILQNNLDSSNCIGELEPSFLLIGSIAEGTRLHAANEIDVTVQFKALEKAPLEISDDNACEILLTGEDHPLEEFSEKHGDKRVLCYDKFLTFFLQTLKRCILQAASSPNWPKDLDFQKDWKHDQCEDCKSESQKLAEESIYSPYTHCKNCLPLVTFSKIGPCLIFQWGSERTVVTVDLIPVFPVKSPGGVFPLFSSVIRTLHSKKPENWVKHLYGIIERDRILPESFVKQASKDEASGPTCDVAIKILNFDRSMNYIIRPGQVMHINEFDEHKKLKKVYIHAKAMKDMMDVDIKSYMIKKVILLDEMKEAILKEDVLLDEALFLALYHSELRNAYKEKVRFKSWENKIERRKRLGSIDIDQEIPTK